MVGGGGGVALGIEIAGLGFRHADGIGDGGEAGLAEGGDVAVLDDGEAAGIDVEHLGAGVVFERLEFIAIAGPAGGGEVGGLDVEEFAALGNGESEGGAALLLFGEDLIDLPGGIGGDVVFDGGPCGGDDLGLGGVPRVREFFDGLESSSHETGGGDEFGESGDEFGHDFVRGAAFGVALNELGESFVDEFFRYFIEGTFGDSFAAGCSGGDECAHALTGGGIVDNGLRSSGEEAGENGCHGASEGAGGRCGFPCL